MAKSKNGKKIDCKYCLRSFYPKGLPAHEKKCKFEHMPQEEANKSNIGHSNLTAIILCIGDGTHKGFIINGQHLEELDLEVIDV